MRTESNSSISSSSLQDSQQVKAKQQAPTTSFLPKAAPIDQRISQAIEAKKMDEEGFLIATLSPPPLTEEIEERFKLLFKRPLQIETKGCSPSSSMSDKWQEGGIIALLQEMEKALNETSLASFEISRYLGERRPFSIAKIQWQAVGSIVPTLLGKAYYRTCWQSLKLEGMTIEDLAEEIDPSLPKSSAFSHLNDIDLRARVICHDLKSEANLYYHFNQVLTLFTKKCETLFLPSLCIEHHIQTGDNNHYTNSTVQCIIKMPDCKLKIALDLLIAKELKHERIFSKQLFLEFAPIESAEKTLKLMFDTSQTADANPSQPLIDQPHQILSWHKSDFNIYAPARYLNLISLNHTVWRTEIASSLMLDFVEEASAKYRADRASAIADILLKTNLKHLKGIKAPLAKAYNALFYLLKTKALEEQELALIRKKLAQSFSKREIENSSTLVQTLFLALQEESLPLPLLFSLLQIFALLGCHAPQENVLLRRHEGLPAVQMSLGAKAEKAEKATILLTLDLSQALATLQKALAHQNSLTPFLSLMAPLYNHFLPLTALLSSQLTPHLEHFAPHSDSQIETVAKALIEQPSPLCAHLGYLLALSSSLFYSPRPLSKPFLQAMPKALLYPAPFTAKALLESIDRWYQRSFIALPSLSLDFSFADPQLLKELQQLQENSENSPPEKRENIAALVLPKNEPLAPLTLVETHWLQTLLKTRRQELMRFTLKRWLKEPKRLSSLKEPLLNALKQNADLSFFKLMQSQLSFEEQEAFLSNLLPQLLQASNPLPQSLSFELLSYLLPLIEKKEESEVPLLLSPFFKELPLFAHLCLFCQQTNREELLLKLIKQALKQQLLSPSDLILAEETLSFAIANYAELLVHDLLLSGQKEAALQLWLSRPHLEQLPLLIVEILTANNEALSLQLRHFLQEPPPLQLNHQDISLIQPLAQSLSSWLIQGKQREAKQLLALFSPKLEEVSLSLMQLSLNQLPSTSKTLKKTASFYLEQFQIKTISNHLWLAFFNHSQRLPPDLLTAAIQLCFNQHKDSLMTDPLWLPCWKKVLEAPKIPFLFTARFFQQNPLKLALNNPEHRSFALKMSKNLLSHLSSLAEGPAKSELAQFALLKFNQLDPDQQGIDELKWQLLCHALPFISLDAHTPSLLLKATDWLQQFAGHKKIDPRLFYALPHLLRKMQTLSLTPSSELQAKILPLLNRLSQIDHSIHPAPLIFSLSRFPLFRPHEEALVLSSLAHFASLDPLLKATERPPFYRHVQFLMSFEETQPLFIFQCLLLLSHPSTFKQLKEIFSHETLQVLAYRVIVKQMEIIEKAPLEQMESEYERLFLFVKELMRSLQLSKNLKPQSTKNSAPLQMPIWQLFMQRTLELIIDHTNGLEVATIKRIIFTFLRQFSSEEITEDLFKIAYLNERVNQPLISMRANQAIFFLSCAVHHLIENPSTSLHLKALDMCCNFFCLIHRVDDREAFKVEQQQLLQKMLQLKLIEPYSESFTLLSLLQGNFAVVELAQPDIVYKAALKAIDAHQAASDNESDIDHKIVLACQQVLTSLYLSRQSLFALEKLERHLEKILSFVSRQTKRQLAKQAQNTEPLPLNLLTLFTTFKDTLYLFCHFANSEHSSLLTALIAKSCQHLADLFEQIAATKKTTLLPLVSQCYLEFLLQADQFGLFQMNLVSLSQLIPPLYKMIARSLQKGDEALLLHDSLFPLIERIYPQLSSLPLAPSYQLNLEMSLAVAYSASLKGEPISTSHETVKGALQLLLKASSIGFFKGKEAMVLKLFERIEPFIVHTFHQKGKSEGDSLLSNLNAIFDQILNEKRPEEKERALAPLNEMLLRISMSALTLSMRYPS